jgi:type I restriction enzyme, S subunit
MAAELTRTTLGAIATKDGYGLVDGPFGSSLPASSYTVSGVPVIRGSNLTLGTCRFVADGFVYVSPETANRLKRSLCNPLDIIFTKKGTLGQTGLVPSDAGYEQYLLSSNQMKLTVDRQLADPLYVYYFVSSPESTEKIIRDSEATGVPKTNVTYLRDFPIALPPLPEQRAIAHMLGTLDDKIELNRRMSATLEAMARALFKSWFVDFDPVRAKAEGRDTGLPEHLDALFPDRLVESELGEIPDGWEVGCLGDVTHHPRRSVRPGEIDPQVPYIALEHMPKRSIALSEWGTGEGLKSNKFEFRRGEILFGKLRPYFHKVGVAPVNGLCSTDIVVVAPQAESWLGFVLGHTSSVEFVDYTDAGSTGTKMPRTSWTDMARYELVLPRDPVVAAFTNLIRPLVERIVTGIHEMRTLGSLRDALLPKLISGELPVLDAENLIPSMSA